MRGKNSGKKLILGVRQFQRRLRLNLETLQEAITPPKGYIQLLSSGANKNMLKNRCG